MTRLPPALTVTNAFKAYKEVQALGGVSLKVDAGEFFGLLGPNGAGKTTLIQSIVGLTRLSSGQISIFGHDVMTDSLAAKRLVGYSPQEVNLDRFLSIEKTLEYQAGFFGKSIHAQKETATRLLDQFNLTAKAKLPYYKLSGGMQKRVLVAKALVSDPQLLILDEPTAGVDVEQRHELWDYLRTLNQNGTAIILTTHYIDEAEALCGRIAIINHGVIRESGSPTELIKAYSRHAVRLIATQPLSPTLFTDLPQLTLNFEGNTVLASGDKPGPMIQTLLERLHADPTHQLSDIEIRYGSLEDVFLKLTGEPL